MDDGSRLPLIAAIVLLFCAMYCAMSETAFSSASRNRLKIMAESGSNKAGKAIYIIDNFERAISTVLIMTNIVHISIATLVTIFVTKRWGVSAVSVSTIITTMTVFFAGEMLPKSLAKKYPEELALFTSGSFKFFMGLFSPLSALLTAVGVGASKLIKGEPELSVTEDELYDIIEDLTEEGALDEDQGDLISSALQFGDLTVESVLTPRVDIVAINAKSSIDEILAVIKSCTHSRLPVYEETRDNIIGILSIRKFIKEYLKNRQNTDVVALLDKPLFIHQSTNVDDLLPLMTKNRQSMAIVTDNYGGTLGLVTIEDIVEELVGEIWDEEDVVEEGIVKISENELSVDADEHVSDVFEEIGFEDPENSDMLVDTVMGAWAFENFSSIPSEGDSFDYHDLHIEIEKMNHNRIVRLKVSCSPGQEEGDDR